MKPLAIWIYHKIEYVAAFVNGTALVLINNPVIEFLGTLFLALLSGAAAAVGAHYAKAIMYRINKRKHEKFQK